MSQLEDLLLKSKSTGRPNSTLNGVPAYSVNEFTGRSQTFTTLDKSDGDIAIQQSVATNFIANTYQTGFNVFKNDNATNVGTFRKPGTATNLASDFTGNASGDIASSPLQAFNTYARFIADPVRSSVGTLKQRYDALSNKFDAANNTAAGVVFGYTRPTNY
jgi:hypothetical protein